MEFRPRGTTWSSLRRSWHRVWQPPWRTLLVVALAGVVYLAWRPGAGVRDGRHDRGHNGLWLEHGWLGDDAWFVRYKKTEQAGRFRDPAAIRALGKRLAQNHITDVFPHLCPASQDGALPGLDPKQARRFLEHLPGVRVLPWIGGVYNKTVFLHDPGWRRNFVRTTADLLEAFPFAGVHLNIEPLESGDPHYLRLLEELRAGMPPGRLLSLAAYPPPTLWHLYPKVHWDEGYYREVSARADQLAVMMYDTALPLESAYVDLMRRWTRECVTWTGTKPVLLGVPTYGDAGVGYHDPRVENLKNALLGIHAGLMDLGDLPANYQGVAIYCSWETDDAEWRFFQEHFLAVP